MLQKQVHDKYIEVNNDRETTQQLNKISMGIIDIIKAN